MHHHHLGYVSSGIASRPPPPPCRFCTPAIISPSALHHSMMATTGRSSSLCSPPNAAVVPSMAHSRSRWRRSSSSPSLHATTCSVAIPPDASDFDRYSEFLVKNGIDDGAIVWVDTLDHDDDDDERCRDPSSTHRSGPPRSFSVLSWNILAQSLYESQYQGRRVQRVALSPPSIDGSSSSSSSSSHPHPHPWPMRLRRIIEVLSHARADVVCLQECERRTFRDDIVPAMSRLGYVGIAQEDDRPDMPTRLREASKHHREPRHHITATFWRGDVFEPVGESIARSRTLTTVLRLGGRGRRSRSKRDDNDDDADDDEDNDRRDDTPTTMPTVAVVNVHLEGHPRRFLERTHQLQHALTDLARRVATRRGDDDDGTTTTTTTALGGGRSGDSTIDGGLNALIVVGDFNCELQSSACSAYLRMGRLGRQAGLGGIHGEDSIVLPPSLLDTTEATEAIHPIMEWGRALPEEAIADVEPHPFRMDGLTSAYPAWLGRDDPRSHFTFCSETSKRPVPGLDQIWYTSMTLERASLRRMFVDDSRLCERYFDDDVEVERRREDDRRRVLATGLPSPGCEYPSDHLPIGAIFNWKWDRGRGYDCVGGINSAVCKDGGEVRVLSVVDAEGNDVQKLIQNSKERAQVQEHAFINPREELDHLLNCCPYDSDEQRSDVKFVLSPIDPPLSLTSSEKPTPDQMMQLDARLVKKAQLAFTASSSVRPWLMNIWKANKKVGRWDRQHLVEKDTIAETSKS
ncbi:hypothetical protein ACHAXA_009446 [Cyclostephanos tholiformis]|uniref:Endonuclease/exonuclease/phosphatase domain-containing protein n=1 Tax=Cyclostephanos tholiformis TaxID=382380 RepID=A0ABD3RNB5_9STRA